MKRERLNLILFILVYACMLGFIVYKAVYLPVTHDEVMTSLHYTKYSVWEIMMYPDAWPNNHILNTLFAKGMMGLFGAEQWAVRFPNVLAFLVYSFAVYRILRHTVGNRSLLFFPLACLFIANPYFIDFFSLCRGYGISSALCTLSVSYLISGYKTQAAKHVWLALIFALLASYANFTLLVFWAAVTMLSGLFFVLPGRENRSNFWRPLGGIALISILYLALIATPIIKMQSTNQFMYWTSTGFFEESVLSLVRLSLSGTRVYFHPEWIAWGIVMLLITCGFIAIFLIFKGRFQAKVFQQPLVISTLVLLLAIGVNLLQTTILKTPNLNGRTALFFFPMFITMFISMHSLFKRWNYTAVKGVLGFIIFFLCLQHFTTTMQKDSVREWRYDAHTFEVLDYMDEHRNGQRVSLETNWLFNPSVYFYSKTGKTPWLDLGAYNKEINTKSWANYYYVMNADYPLLEDRFEVALKFDGMVLLKNKAYNEEQ